MNPNVTPNVTVFERERDTERDMAERDTPHAHERDTPEPSRVPGWHRRIGPVPVLKALRGLSDYAAPRWVDHACRVRLPDGRWCYIAEPYSLDTEALAGGPMTLSKIAAAILDDTGERISETSLRQALNRDPRRFEHVAGARPRPWAIR